MKRKAILWSLSLCVSIGILEGELCAPCSALEAATISSEAIAVSAYQVADRTKTTGRCYAAVSRALVPLGVTLTGAAAYEAEEQLRRDRRFVPLIIFSVDQLRRGDIIVYGKSQSHPYGHIAVYQGNYREASDHLSPVTHTKNYGGAIVFRLANEIQMNDPFSGNLALQQNGQKYFPPKVENTSMPPNPASSTQPSTLPTLRRHPVIRQFLRRLISQLI